MIDADDRMVLRHLESEPLVRFRRMDVYEEGVGAMMASARESGARVVLVGVHLCGELSRRAVELFSQHGDVLVLSPCCLVREVRAGETTERNVRVRLPRLAKRLGVNCTICGLNCSRPSSPRTSERGSECGNAS